MTGALIRHRYLLWIVAALLVLGGGLGVAFILIGNESARADDLANEANLRGNAVATLAGDVRALREQVRAHGGTPIVPDPTKAIPSLSARAEVPVPIPGPAGPSGATGASGAAGSPGASGVPGVRGASGAPGATGATGPVGPAGPAGVAGQPGKDGRDGTNGADGQPPAGWTFSYQGVDYTCSPTAESDPSSPRYACTSDESSPPSVTVNPQAALLTGAFVLSGRRERENGRGIGSAGRGRHRVAGRRGGAHR